MQVLIVGAGAVGQAYGWHLQQAGWQVTYLVRPHHVATLRQGLVVYPGLGKPRWTPSRFQAFDIVTTPAEVAARRFDQVWLTVPSPALAEPWLDELAAAWGDAGIVMLQPGLDDRARLLQLVPEARLCRGVITLSSFHAPLPGQQVPEPGMAWWFPPLTPTPLSGPAAIVLPAVAALRKGRCPAKAFVGREVDAAYGSAFLLPLVAAMETADWSFAGLRQPKHRAQAAAAIRQALTVTAAEKSKGTPWFTPLIRGPVIGLVTRVAPLVVPFDFEAFLRVHFTKVGEQTRQAIAGYAAKGQARGLQVDALDSLVRLLSR
jgi:hypothetical protein